MAFTKLKALPREEPPRTVTRLANRIGRLLERFVPSNFANFSHAPDSNGSSEMRLGRHLIINTGPMAEQYVQR